MENSGRNYIGYEYFEVAVAKTQAQIFSDGYLNFGWELVGQETTVANNQLTLKFRRDRKLKNKAKLTRLRRQFDSLVKGNATLEKKKTQVAAIASLSLGIIGCAFLAGSIFLMNASHLVLMVLLAIPGFICWILPYFVYRRLKANHIAALNPQIEANFDVLYEIGEKASRLL